MNLNPVSSVYKEGNQEMQVGCIADVVPEMVSTSDRKGLESVDLTAVMNIVVQGQQRMFKEYQEPMAAAQEKVWSPENAPQLKLDKDAMVAQQDGNNLPAGLKQFALASTCCERKCKFGVIGIIKMIFIPNEKATNLQVAFSYLSPFFG